MDAGRLFEAIPNFSEGRRPEVISSFAAAAGAEAHLLDVDPDADHHRVVVSMAAEGRRLADAVLACVGAAVEHVDMRSHQGVHPRVGAADVVPIVPLGRATLQQGRELAREIGERIWAEFKVPVFFYGEGHSLADIRHGRATPEVGGPGLHPTAGGVSVGARLALVAFNVLLPGVGLPEARILASSLREARGGLRGVQALAFELPGGRVQLSMNLFRIDETPPAAVLAELARREVLVGEQQLVGLCPAAAAGEVAAGRLLEARLAASAARTGARMCRAQGDEEHLALALRLVREADQISATGVDQAALLAAAERAAALVHVLRAAKVVDVELEAMLEVAARGFQAALLMTTIAGEPARMRALDSRLESL